MDSDIRVRPFREGDEYQVVALFKEVFGASISIEQWSWKYQGQSSLTHKSVVAVDERGAVVGHWGGVPVRMRFKGESAVAYQAVDVMLKKECRKSLTRGGLYFELGRFFYENIPSFVYGFANRDHLRLGRVFGFFEECISVYDTIVPACNYRLPFYRLDPIDWSDKGIDILWDKVCARLGWSIVRDRNFLDWRYGKNPFRSHKIYGLRKRWSKAMLGWVVTREEGDAIFLMDMIFREGHLESLLMRTISEAYGQGKKRVMFWLHERYRDQADLPGLVWVKRGTYIPNFVWRKRSESDEMREKLYYTMGDTDFL